MTALVDKVFKIVDCLADGGEEEQSLAALGRETGLPKATLHRLLRDLVAIGIVDHSSGGYSPGGRLFELGGRVPEYRRLREAAVPHLLDLSATTREAVHLGILRDREVLYLARTQGHHGVRLPTSAGSRQPAYCSALGKTLLAHAPASWDGLFSDRLRPRTGHTIVLPKVLLTQFSRIREDGIATEFEEFQIGLGCVAAPVRNAEGTVVAAISVSGNPRAKSSPALHARVRQAAAHISLAYQNAMLVSGA